MLYIEKCPIVPENQNPSHHAPPRYAKTEVPMLAVFEVPECHEVPS
jgi:hypothetical protein